jgi:hypothetical protein
MEQLFLCCVLGSESRKHLVWQLIAVHRPEGQYNLVQAPRIQMMKVQFQILLVCSMQYHTEQQHFVWKTPRRQEIL